MSAKLLALLLVFAWIDLAALDLLEDLRSGPGDGSYTQSSKIRWHGPRRHLSTTNNIVESAVTLRATDSRVACHGSSPTQLNPLTSCDRVLDLHKLHRVFLI